MTRARIASLALLLGAAPACSGSIFVGAGDAGDAGSGDDASDSGVATDSTIGDDGSSGGACTTSADCTGGRICGFPESSGCAARGQCFPASGVMCGAFSPGCACDGTTINLVCNGLPNNYAGKPLASSGDCPAQDGSMRDGTTTDAGGPVPCAPMGSGGPSFCNPGEICVAQTTTGGPCGIVPDSGVCPPGTIKSGPCCVLDQTSYGCQPTPTGCGSMLSCTCAMQLCQCQCDGASGNELKCSCQAP
jgi:hypothetical protein